MKAAVLAAAVAAAVPVVRAVAVRVAPGVLADLGVRRVVVQARWGRSLMTSCSSSALRLVRALPVARVVPVAAVVRVALVAPAAVHVVVVAVAWAAWAPMPASTPSWSAN